MHYVFPLEAVGYCWLSQNEKLTNVARQFQSASPGDGGTVVARMPSSCKVRVKTFSKMEGIHY